MGYLYIIKVEGFEIYKIGIAKTDLNLGQRMASIQTGCPFRITLTACYRCSNYLNLEKLIHYKFKGCRTYGEWFKIDVLQELTDYIYAKGQDIETGYVPPNRTQKNIAKPETPAMPRKQPKTKEQEAYCKELLSSR